MLLQLQGSSLTHLYKGIEDKILFLLSGLLDSRLITLCRHIEL